MRPLVLNENGLLAVLPEGEPLEVGSPTAPEHAVRYTDIGDLADLLTTDKSNLVAAINELFRRVAIPLVEWPEVTEFTVQYLSSLSCVLLEWSGVNLASARLEIFRGSEQGELIFEMAGVRFSAPPNRIQIPIARIPGLYTVRLTPVNERGLAGNPVLRTFTIPAEELYGTVIAHSVTPIDENQARIIARARLNNPLLDLEIV